MAEEKNILIYDSDCSLCTFQMKVLTWLDWLERVRLLPIKDPEAKVVAPTLTREDLLEAIHVVTPANKIHRGARCIRYLSLRMPVLFPVWLFLWIPGVIRVAEKIYQWISRNRHLLSRWFGCGEACSIMPAKKRDGDGLE
ncbi:MAG: hypothetical protein CMO80_15390 [Verrucomicrobiales bacterium]|nr:hypothetical protein [Verrucomicrobiales bacterium]|tara:strand:+ start:1730 stop:2149 length:420 start_codon:yes stop_codon:yes gene_type:complete